MSRRRPFVPLTALVRATSPTVPDPAAAIAAGLVRVDGLPVTNPRALVRRAATVTVGSTDRPLRGAAKLRAALTAFGCAVDGRVALDAGASTGGFTSVLLAAGARRVYAVDAGFGQLLGSLRADPRVVNLERTNIGALSPELVPEPVQLLTVDLSYLALADAAPQLEAVHVAADAEAVAVVKPMFELGLPAPPADPSERVKAVELAAAAFEAQGWEAAGAVESPVTGRRGAVEHLLHLRRRAG